jgi:peptidoglycan/xylan/chitin deacetylase (PgdA/CDA1 family)
MSARTAIRPVVAQTLRSAARGYDRIARPGPGAVVLAYHQVGGPKPGSVNITPAAFAAHMAMVADARSDRPVHDLDRLVTRTGTGEPDDASVVITFDDGTADFIDHALPILVELGLPVTLYLATGHVDEGRSFWDDGTVLSWAALRDAHATGLVTIGSHTHDHLLLDRTEPARMAADLDRSIGRIEDEIGVRPTHFAYPKALAPSAAARDLVRARFATAALAGGRPNRVATTDLWALDRTPIVVADSPDDVARKLDGGLRLEATVRSAVDRVRYRGATR